VTEAVPPSRCLRAWGTKLPSPPPWRGTLHPLRVGNRVGYSALTSMFEGEEIIGIEASGEEKGMRAHVMTSPFARGGLSSSHGRAYAWPAPFLLPPPSPRLNPPSPPPHLFPWHGLYRLCPAVLTLYRCSPRFCSLEEEFEGVGWGGEGSCGTEKEDGVGRGRLELDLRSESFNAERRCCSTLRWSR
jgi:hypothetical protein